MIKDKSHIKEAVLYGGLKYDADTTALVVENKKYTDIPRDLNIQPNFRKRMKSEIAMHFLV
ncbi:hypothetical protein GAR93_13365, partial [Bacteroides uniformis]